MLTIAIVTLVTSLLAGCAGGSGSRIPLDVGASPTSLHGMNLSADDLLDPLTARQKVEIYLDELLAAGYKREIRVILPPDWGPFIYTHWFPAIRARGFKVLAILGQEKRDSADIPQEAMNWVRHILPLVKDDLIGGGGVQVVNEEAYWFTPSEYLAWHRQVVPIIRELAPGVPIVAGDGFAKHGPNNIERWETFHRLGFSVGRDYDIVSIHLTGEDDGSWLKKIVSRLNKLPPARYWITEGDWGHLPWLAAHGLTADKSFIYSWNSLDGWGRRQ